MVKQRTNDNQRQRTSENKLEDQRTRNPRKHEKNQK